MDGSRDHHVKQSKPGSERQISHIFFHVWDLDLKTQNKYNKYKRGLAWEGGISRKRENRTG
jgi:hypothetical protein